MFCNVPFKLNWTKISEEIVNKGKSYSAASRGVLVSNDKLLKKTDKLKLATRGNTALFAQILRLVRQQNKHRGITQIKVGSPDWLNLKEICKLATEFCNEFQIDLKIGYKYYITLGLQRMKSFSIYKFKTLNEIIYEVFEGMQVIERDRTPQATEDMHSTYLAHIADKTGYSQGYKDAPEKYQFFVKAKEIAKEMGVSNKVYIEAQFRGLEWVNAIPYPIQLIGNKAIERLQKYAFENNIKLGDKKQVIDFKKIRKWKKQK